MEYKGGYVMTKYTSEKSC